MSYLDVGVSLTRPDDPLAVRVQPASLARLMGVYANAGLATRSVVGMSDITAVGTPATGDDVDGVWHNLPTTAIANNTAGWLSAFTLIRPSWWPEIAFKVKTHTALTSVRLQIGCFSASPDAVPTPTTLHGAWFRYWTGQDGTAFWRCCSAAGAAPQITVTDVPIVVSTPYLLAIQLRGTDVRFVIGSPAGVTTVTHATVPAAATPLGIGARVTTLSAAASALKIARATVCHP